MCVFIFVVFKKFIDCIIIEIPLNDKIAEHNEIDRDETGSKLSSFVPRVTSKNPYSRDDISNWFIPVGFNRK